MIKRLMVRLIALYAVMTWPHCALAQAADALKLSGIFHRTSGTSSALFILADKTQKLVSQGRLIDAETQLLTIEESRVQLSRDGRVFWMALPNGNTSKAATTKESPSDIPLKYSGRDETSDDAYRLRVIRLKSALKPQLDKDYISKGVLITNDRALDLFNGTALKVGDIVWRVNGNGFSSAEDMERFAYEWKQTHQYTVKVLRDGAIVEIKP